MRKTVALLVAFCMLCCMLPMTSAAEDVVVFDAAEIPAFSHTRSEVIRRYNEAFQACGSYSDWDKSSYYDVMPCLEAPYNQGVLKQDTLDAMTAMTNYYRWLVGVAPLKKTASNDDGLQRAALIRNFEFSHDVSDESKPENMDQAFWDSGKVWHNILAWGSTPRGSVNSWCNEGYCLYDNSWDTIGHRYALISATLSEISFGYAGGIAIGRCEEFENVMDVPFAAFPAPGPMPTELLYSYYSAWSVELNTEVFEIDYSADICVTVTDLNTGNSYECTHDNGKLQGYSLLSFVQPEQETYLNDYFYQDGSSFQVRITGLKERSSGKAAELRYQVDFISIRDEMATIVTECGTSCGTTLYLPYTLRDEASMEKLTAGMPKTVIATTQSGLSYEIPVVGEWSFNLSEKSWTARADAASLPEHVSDPGGLLNQITIQASEDFDYTGTLSFGGSQLLLGQPGTINVSRYMLGTPTVRVYQIKPDGTTVLRFTETSPNCSNDSYGAAFAIDAWTAADSGVWFAVYGNDWLGGFVVGMEEISITCLHERTREERKEFTCTESGSVDIYCEICGELLQHETLEAPGHDYRSEVKAATCTEAGFTAHTCTRCGDRYITDEIAALGHDYQLAVIAPTCTESGYTVHTCTRCGDSFVSDPVDALGHDWNEPTYYWSEDYRYLTAQTVCRHDPSHSRTETAHSTAVSDDATCTEAGTVVFTAVFEDTMFAAQSIAVTGVPMGHAVSEWTLIRAATCLEAGMRSGLCTRCGESAEEIIPALGHAWSEPFYEWTEDNSNVTATHICANDPSHVETEKVNTTSKITKPATVAEEGEITYTAIFEHPEFTTQTKVVKTPKLLSNPFIDVKEGAYYYDAVMWAVNANPQVTAGTSKTTFSPSDTCTRAQVVTFLWRAKGCPEPKSNNNPFKDVKEGDYYYKAVLWAVENNITAGTSTTTFSPNAGCTRAQVVTFLWRTQGQPKPTSSKNPFKDVTGGYYYDAVLWAVENNITAGTSAATFSPENTCTRGQIVTFLYRAFAA